MNCSSCGLPNIDDFARVSADGASYVCEDCYYTEPMSNIPNQSYFPLLIRYTDTNEMSVVQSPSDILSGMPFRVIQCNYGPTQKEVLIL